MQPSDQGIETVAWIPVIDYRNTSTSIKETITRQNESFIPGFNQDAPG